MDLMSVIGWLLGIVMIIFGIVFQKADPTTTPPTPMGFIWGNLGNF